MMTEPISVNGTAPAVAPFRSLGLGYLYEPPEYPRIRLRATHVRSERGGTRAWVFSEPQHGGTIDERLGMGDVDLTGARATKNYHDAMDPVLLLQMGDIEWERTLRRFFWRIIEAEAAGSSRLTIGGENVAYQALPYLVEPFLVERATNLLYGPGGAGKGYLAISLAVHVALGRPWLGMPTKQGKVLYLDWEDHADIFTNRMVEIAAGLGVVTPYIDYRRCEHPLAQHIEQYSAEVDEQGYALVIVDSVETATQSSEHSSLNDRVVGMGRALRHLRCTHLLIDHVSNEGRTSEKLAGKAINGIMKMNLCRNAFELKPDPEDEGVVGVFHTKANHARKQRPIGLRLAWPTTGTMTIARQDGAVRESAVLVKTLTRAQQIHAYLLRVGSSSAKAIGQDLGMTEGTARYELNHKRGKLFTRLDDGEWGAIAVGVGT